MTMTDATDLPTIVLMAVVALLATFTRKRTRKRRAECDEVVAWARIDLTRSADRR
jgi:hypothetical protein